MYIQEYNILCYKFDMLQEYNIICYIFDMLHLDGICWVRLQQFTIIGWTDYTFIYFNTSIYNNISTCIDQHIHFRHPTFTYHVTYTIYFSSNTTHTTHFTKQRIPNTTVRNQCIIFAYVWFNCFQNESKTFIDFTRSEAIPHICQTHKLHTMVCA